VLLRAADLGAEYVDLEWDAATPESVAALHAAGAQVIISRHDFAGMPAELATTWWPELAQRGADIVKLVGTAHDVRDCLAIVRVFRQADRPTVAIAMGQAGVPSRILALREPTCFLTYAMLGDDTATAPGQVSVRDMRELYTARRLGPATRAYGLLGPHAESERLAEYNGWFAQDGIDGVAVPLSVSPEADAAAVVAAFRELPMWGWHIHGQALQLRVGQAVDEFGPTARRAGKVNAIAARADGALVGHWVESPREQYALWAGS
jgi:3-dehydroquinate dehydratase/shikimate dehydrogenase